MMDNQSEMGEPTYYEILGLSSTNDQVAIKKAYHKLALQYHPDKPGGNEEKFKQIRAAYEILSDDEQKAAYDIQLQEPSSRAIRTSGFDRMILESLELIFSKAKSLPVPGSEIDKMQSIPLVMNSSVNQVFTLRMQNHCLNIIGQFRSNLHKALLIQINSLYMKDLVAENAEFKHRLTSHVCILRELITLNDDMLKDVNDGLIKLNQAEPIDNLLKAEAVYNKILSSNTMLPNKAKMKSRLVITPHIDGLESNQIDQIKIIIANQNNLPVDKKIIEDISNITDPNDASTKISRFQSLLRLKLISLCSEHFVTELVSNDKLEEYSSDLRVDSIELPRLIEINKEMLQAVNDGFSLLRPYLSKELPRILNLSQGNNVYAPTINSFRTQLIQKVNLTRPYSLNQKLKEDILNIKSKREGTVSSITKCILMAERVKEFETEHINCSTEPLLGLWHTLAMGGGPSPVPKMDGLESWVATIKDQLKEKLKDKLKQSFLKNQALLPGIDSCALNSFNFDRLVILNRALDCNVILDDIGSGCVNGPYSNYISRAKARNSQEKNISKLEQQYNFLLDKKDSLKKIFSQLIKCHHEENLDLDIDIDILYQSMITEDIVQVEDPNLISNISEQGLKNRTSLANKTVRPILNGDDNPSVDDHRIMIIEQLRTYIRDVEKNKKNNTGEINYEHGFNFFKKSRGLNRNVNYLLSKLLINELNDLNKTIQEIFEKDNIDILRNSIIEKNDFKKKPHFQDRGMRSVSLNRIIEDARDPSLPQKNSLNH